MHPQSITIPLTQGKCAVIDAEDHARVAAFKWSAYKSRGKWYARRGVHIDGKFRHVLLHRFIMDAPADREVDHINGDGLLCMKANMRLCTHLQNMGNQQISSNNTSGFLGVTWHADSARWCAQIQGAYLGLYETAEEAAHAYDTAARERFGAFANLNFPDDATRVEPRKGGPRRSNTSGFVGVSYRKDEGKWTARLTRNGKRMFLGYFRTAEEAAAAREEKMRQPS